MQFHQMINSCIASMELIQYHILTLEHMTTILLLFLFLCNKLVMLPAFTAAEALTRKVGFDHYSAYFSPNAAEHSQISPQIQRCRPRCSECIDGVQSCMMPNCDIQDFPCSVSPPPICTPHCSDCTYYGSDFGCQRNCQRADCTWYLVPCPGECTAV
jgi:hypothetical protein